MKQKSDNGLTDLGPGLLSQVTLHLFYSEHPSVRSADQYGGIWIDYYEEFIAFLAVTLDGIFSVCKMNIVDLPLGYRDIKNMLRSSQHPHTF